MDFVVWSLVFDDLSFGINNSFWMFSRSHGEVHLIVPTHDLKLRLEVRLLRVTNFNIDPILWMRFYTTRKRLIGK